MKSEFCSKCCEKEARIELLQTKHYEEVLELKKRIEYLEGEVDKLTFDVAFYGGSMVNLSCNDK